MNRKSIWNRSRTYVLAAALAFSLAGCQSRQEEVKVVEKPGEEIVIRLFSSGYMFSSSNQAKYWSENFAAQTGIPAVVSYEEQGYYGKEGEDSRTLMRKRIESDRPDDMYIVAAEDMIEYARLGYIMDLSDFEFVDNLSETALQLSTIDGRVYCLPLSYTGFGLYWNTDMLETYGLTVPGNYDELIHVWDTLLENGILPYAGNKGHALTVPAMCVSFAEVYQSDEKDRLIKELADGTTPVSTYAREGFEFIKLMCDKGYLDPKESLERIPNDDAITADFKNGRVACVAAAADSAAINDPETMGFQVKMTGWPLLEDGVISVVGTSQKLCINPKSQHLDIVTKFVEIVGTEDGLMQCTDDGQVSAGKKNDPSKYRETEREFDELIQMDGQIPNTDMNLKLNLWDNIRDISRLILSGEADVDDACRLLDEAQMKDIAAGREDAGH